jgi:hypothetical protein
LDHAATSAAAISGGVVSNSSRRPREADLQDDRFISIAFTVTGCDDNWRAALEQTSRLLELYESNGRDCAPVLRIVLTLVRRAENFDDTGQYLDELISALGTRRDQTIGDRDFSAMSGSQGIDPVTTAKLGGWKSPAHVFQTYGHAQDDVSLTDRLFETEIDTGTASGEQDR